jgi:hypothetical protein
MIEANGRDSTRNDTGAPRPSSPAIPGSSPSPTIARDTVRIPGMTASGPVVVRPALAVLFRVAVGPEADRYVPRFLAYERAGHARPGWNWPAFLAPPVWAFYRKLWPEGIAFSLLPVAGAFGFAAFGGALEGTGAAWWIALAVLVWLLPAVLSALSADALLWGRMRRVVAGAEIAAKSATKAVESLSGGKPTSVAAAVVLGGGAIALAIAALGPPIRAEYVAHAGREAVARTLASLRVVQEAVEAARDRTGTIAHARNVARLLAQSDGRYVGDVAIDPANGRVRVSLGPSVPGAAGKSILLAPTVDDAERVQWVCVPVDIPARYLPEYCRR